MNHLPTSKRSIFTIKSSSSTNFKIIFLHDHQLQNRVFLPMDGQPGRHDPPIKRTRRFGMPAAGPPLPSEPMGVPWSKARKKTGTSGNIIVS